MKDWSKLKKVVVISAVIFFGLAGMGAITGQDKLSQNLNTGSKQVQGTQTQQQPVPIPTPVQPAQPQPAPAPAPTPVPTPAPQPKNNCDPNYSGACVPIASDVDCAGGSGNGPAYVAGPVYVTGSDIYGLDRDGDGIGCE